MDGVEDKYVGYCHEDGAIEVADRFRDGTIIPMDWRYFIERHEEGHKDGYDHADIVMFYEFPGDKDKALDVNAFRYADLKNGVENEGAETARMLFERFEGTGFQPYLDAIRERAEELELLDKAERIGGYRARVI